MALHCAGFIDLMRASSSSSVTSLTGAAGTIVPTLYGIRDNPLVNVLADINDTSDPITTSDPIITNIRHLLIKTSVSANTTVHSRAFSRLGVRRPANPRCTASAEPGGLSRCSARYATERGAFVSRRFKPYSRKEDGQ